MALNPTGDRLFATGWTCATPAVNGLCEDADFATIAYDTTSGTELWVQTYGFAGYPFGGAINVVEQGAQSITEFGRWVGRGQKLQERFDLHIRPKAVA